MAILLLIAAAYIADKFNKPFHVTAACAALYISSAIIDGEGIGDILLGAVFLSAICLAYFFTLIKFSDNLAMWLLVLLGFPVALFLVPLAMGT